MRNVILALCLVLVGCGGTAPRQADAVGSPCPDPPATFQFFPGCDYSYTEPTVRKGFDPDCSVKMYERHFTFSSTTSTGLIRVTIPSSLTTAGAAQFYSSSVFTFDDGVHQCGFWSGRVSWVPGWSIEIQARCDDHPSLVVDAFFATAE